MSSPGNQGGYQPPAYLSVPKKFTMMEMEDVQSPNSGNRSARSFSKLRPDDWRTLSGLSIHTNLQEILISNDASIQNHGGVNWADPNLSVFDPQEQGGAPGISPEYSIHRTNPELALLMEENMFEVENNFPAFERIQSSIEKKDQEYMSRLQKRGVYWTDKVSVNEFTPVPQQQQGLQPSADQKQLTSQTFAPKKALVESFGFSSQDNIAEENLPSNRPKGVDCTFLDRAALDVDNQSSRLSMRGAEVQETEGFPAQELVLEQQDFRTVLRKSDRSLPPLALNPNLHASISTGLNIQNGEDCEVSDMDTDTPCSRYEYYASLSSRQRQSHGLVASQQLFEELLGTKTGSDPVEIERRHLVSESRTDSA